MITYNGNKRILIKTYLFSSGLLYLALSLKKKLEKQGNYVVLFPKAKYMKKKNSFVKTYQMPEVNGVSVSAKKSISSQIVKAINDHSIDTVLSFETLMQNSSWIAKAKRFCKVIDIPMIEWVTPAYFENGAYNIFDEIWAVNQLTYGIFVKKYDNIRLANWDVVDYSLFYPGNKTYNNPFTFYHPGSTNKVYSSKNTEMVLEAFRASSLKDAKLVVTGGLGLRKNNDNNIVYIDEQLNRQQVAAQFRNCNCLIAPSSREGLGMSLYEAKACGAEVITTDIPPMNYVDTNYLCKVDSVVSDKNSLTPKANINFDSLVEQIQKVYKRKLNNV